MAASRYSLHPGFTREAAAIAKLPEKTGKSLDEWLKLIKKSGPNEPKLLSSWLKAEGLTTNYASFVAALSQGKGGAANYRPEDLVEAIFAGPKAIFRPVYEAILDYGFGVGPDVKVCPCATIVPFYRNHVIAQVRVPNRTRLDLGFALGATKPEGRLIDTGGFAKKDRITHRLEITALSDFDDQAKKWFRRAYELDTT